MGYDKACLRLLDAKEGSTMSALQPLIEQGFPAHLAEQITAEILDQYGEEPCTREQAAERNELPTQ